MKVLTLTQPWATLMALDEKRFETRSWSTPYRGRLAIHAAKGWPPDGRDLCFKDPFAVTLVRHGITTLRPLDEVRGHIIAVVDLIGCVSTNQPTDGDLFAREIWQGCAPAQHETAFGDYSPNRFAWLTRNVHRLARPIAYRGALGLPSIDTATERLIDAALSEHAKETKP